MPFGADSSGPMDACGRHLANTIKQSKLAAMRAVVTITINFIFLVHFTVAVSVAKKFFFSYCLAFMVICLFVAHGMRCYYLHRWYFFGIFSR